MRFQAAILAVAASFALVGAQDLSGIPQCAIPCFVAAIPGSNCGVTDTNCLCTTGRPAIESTLLTCAPERCDENEISSLTPAVSSLCAAAGVTISNIPTSPPSSGTASATGSPSTSQISGSRTMTGSASPTGSEAAEQTANAAAGKLASYGVVAMGMAAVFGL
uniref:CFEM4 n=1 Tax=Alternaria solani TaxID=48100 RepID=A0AA49K4Q0_ALTSO|nr:CFEM4 [Alternaria solani]